MSLYLGDLDLTIGIPGENGISATHSWDGSTLTITSASGTSSMDLKGPQGDQGPKGENGYSIYHINRSLSVDPRYEENNIYYLNSESLKSITGTGKVFTTNDLLFSTVNGDLYKLYDTEVDGVLLSKIGNLKGPTGANGKSAYQMAVSAGYTGTESDLNKALSNATNHVLKTGDAMTGALTINHKDGINTIRPAADMNNNQPEHKSQLSIVANGNVVINRWKKNNDAYTHLSSFYLGDKSAQIYNVSENKTYNLFGEHNTDLLTSQIQNLLQGGNISMVKSVQRGVISMGKNSTATATINPVNINKAVVLYGGSKLNSSSGNDFANWICLQLTNATTVTASRVSYGSYAENLHNASVPYQVIEYY